MLSEHEYQKTQWQLNNIPKEIKGKNRNNLRQRLKKKIKEHEYATTYQLFEPLPYIPYYINRVTSEQTLRTLIQAATTTNEFTLDTESIAVRGENNIPTLIQLQIILPRHPSLIMIIEMHHLPHQHHPSFTLIQELIRIAFSSEKTLFIFGSKDELIPFIKFNLFTNEQIKSMQPIDLQQEFKRFWFEQHPHRPFNSTNNTSINNCLCETCLGRNSTNSWSLQDSVAFELNEYLPKIYTNSNFNIGLDPELFHRNSNELQHRQKLSTYAYNDCLSMQKIIEQMKIKKFKFKSYSTTDDQMDILELSPISSNDEFIISQIRFEPNRIVSFEEKDEQPIHSLEQRLSNNKKEEISIDLNQINESELIFKKLSSQSSTPSTEKTITSHRNINTDLTIINWKSNSSNNKLSSTTSTNNQTTPTRQSSIQLTSDQNKLTDVEKKKIHNRTCTLKQRRRYYRYEIIRRDIDNRFSITQIKNILRRLHIPFNAINKSTSSITNKTSLYIGIKNPSQINTYERVTHHLFSKQHYDQLKCDQQRLNQRQYQRKHEHERAQEPEDRH